MEKQIIQIKHPHITNNINICNNSPIIKGTKISVRSIVAYYNDRLSPEEIVTVIPYVKLVEICDVLAFYYDNKELIDKELEEHTDSE